MTFKTYYNLIYRCERIRGNGRLHSAWVAFNQARRTPSF
jgi:hypothetical protein